MMKIIILILLISLVNLQAKAEYKKVNWQTWFTAKEFFKTELYKDVSEFYLEVPSWFNNKIKAEAARDTLEIYLNKLAHYQQDYLLARKECFEEEYDNNDNTWPISAESCAVLRAGILLKKYNFENFAPLLAQSGLLRSDNLGIYAEIYTRRLFDYSNGLITREQIINDNKKWFRDHTRTNNSFFENEYYEFKRYYTNWFTDLSNSENKNNNETKPIVEANQSGTGFYVTNEGHVVTNNHVVEGCKNIFANKEKLSLIIADPVNDLAILKSKSRNNNFLYLESNTPKKGEEVLVIGYPFGKDLSSESKITQGIISSLEGMGNDFSRLQIDAAIQPGNSGGPVFNKSGNVVGVAVATANIEAFIEAYGTIPQNMNFAIKTNVLRMLLEAKNIKVNNKTGNTKIPNEQIFRNTNKAVVFINCR